MTSDDAADRRARLLRLLLQEQGIATGDDVVRVARDGVLRASLTQERMWFLDRTTSRSFVNNVPLGARLRGPLDLDALQAALNALVARHESLRTCFSLDGPVVTQRIQEALEIPIVQHDLSAATDPGATAARLDYVESRQPFDLSRVPLLRVTVLRLVETDHLLLITAHHAVWDGWSTGLLVHELAAHYQAARSQKPAAMPPLAVQHVDWAAWERRHLTGETLGRQQDFWRRELADAPTVRLPEVLTDSSGLSTDRGAYVTFVVPPALTAALADLGRAEDATLYVVLLAGFTALLHGVSGDADLTVGGLVANRIHAEIESLIGYFVNMAPLRSRTTPLTTFVEHLRRTRATTLGVQEHQALPRGHILRSGSQVWEGAFDESPYTVTFQLQTAPREESEFGDLELEIHDRHTRTAPFDIGVVLWQRLSDLSEYEGLRGWCEYRTDMFDEPAARRLMARYVSVLEAVVHDPSIRLTDLPIAAPDERARAVLAGPSEEGASASVPDAIRQLAHARPGSVAVRHHEGSAQTYAELDAAITAAAKELATAGAGQEALVAIVDDGSPALLTAVGAVMACGGAFVLLDPRRPDVRSGEALRCLRPAAAVVDPAVDVPLPAGTHRLCLTGPAPPLGSDDRPLPPLPQGLAAVTLLPKPANPYRGVMLHHAALTQQAHGTARWLGLGGDDVVAAVVPPVGAPVSHLLAPLVCGAQLRLVRRDVAGDANALAALLAEDLITVAHLPASGLCPLMDVGASTRAPLPALRAVVVDDIVPAGVVRRWRRTFPSARLLTAHAVAACAGPVTTFEPTGVGVHADAATVGFPLPDTSVYVLDAHLSPVAPGARGELCVGGPRIGRGYLDDPRRTAERFVPDPFATGPGARMYRTGRRAFRREAGPVELTQAVDPSTLDGDPFALEEIRAALRAHPGLGEVHVVVSRDSELGVLVAAYVVPAARLGDDESHVERCPTVDDEIRAVGRVSDPTSSSPVDRLQRLHAARVLEIGCGGVRSVDSVTRTTAEAADLDDVPLGHYDLVVLDSVVQRFPSAAYLERFIRRTLDWVRPGGAVFVGDVQDLRLRPALHSAIQLGRAAPGTPVSEVRALVAHAMRHETELAVDPRFFVALRRVVPRIGAVEVLPRLAPHGDETAATRFDVVLHLDARLASPAPEARISWSDGPGATAVALALSRRPATLLVQGVPDSRGMPVLAVQRALDEPLPGTTADGLRAASAASPAGLLPDELVALGARHGYVTALSLDLAVPGHFDALLQRESGAGEPALLALDGPDAVEPPGPAANAPTTAVRAAVLRTELREAVRRRLPTLTASMAFVVLENLPRSPDGTVNEALLPSPIASSRRRRRRVGPRSSIEREVATIWSDVLEIYDIGVTDRLVDDLDTDDILVAVLAEQLADVFGAPLTEHDLRQEQTIAAISRRVSAPGAWDAPG